MRTRSNQVPMTFEDTGKRRRVLLRSHLRKNGTDEPHACSICLSTMIMLDKQAAWMQCPMCNDVLHEACMLAWIRQSSTDTFNCPNCTHEFARNSIDLDPAAWCADDVIENLLESDDEDFGSDK